MAESIKAAAKSLRESDICFLKSLCAPPRTVQDVLKCVFYLNPTGSEKMYIESPPEALTWGLVQSMLGTPHFVETLKSYKVETMTFAMYYRIAEILRSHDPVLNQQDVKKVTTAAAGLFEWITALMLYFGDHNDVYNPPAPPPIPKSEKLIENEEARATAESGIQAFEAHLRELEQEAQRKLAAEQAALAEAEAEETEQ